MNIIEQVLREKIGLDAASVGSSAIERTVRLRMKSLGLKTVEEYQRRLESSRDEWEELVESVIVTETWFFRDRDSFNALVQLVQTGWLASDLRPPASGIRLLSLPCASGEEPYSLAMALLDAEIPPARFTIDAVDLSGRALDRAKRAVYEKNSFRGESLDFRRRHFEATRDGHVLHPRVRDCVRFHRANIFEEDFFAGCPAYDFIFCRNLLIYFDGVMRAKALDKLDRLLAPQGVLFVGPAELSLATPRGFVSANFPMAFACRKADAVPKTSRKAGRQKAEGRPSTSDYQSLGVPLTQDAPPTLAHLSEARQLADAGKLAEAEVICQAYLNRQGPSAQAYYLLGLVCDAGGNPQAMDYYRKALYLEPDHYETLLHMSLLLEKNGNPVGARTFKRRAERVQQKP